MRAVSVCSPALGAGGWRYDAHHLHVFQEPRWPGLNSVVVEPPPVPLFIPLPTAPFKPIIPQGF